MDRLSGLDASFLYLEDHAQLMHVCALIKVDPSTIEDGYDFARFEADLADRVGDLWLFRRKLKFVPGRIDHPVWVHEREFNIHRHVHRLAVPAPGGDKEIAELCAHLAGIPLDRTRPLWEIWVIEGLADGCVAIFSKMHHASVDGVSGANMISVLCSLEPVAPPIDLEEYGGPADARVSTRALVASGVVHNALKPLCAWQLVKPTVTALARTVKRVKAGTAMAAPLTAPRTSFNGTITGRRSIAFADLSLDRIKDIKNAIPHATVNDVVLAITGGALRRYLDERGELPEASLLAAVPVSVHETSQAIGGSNKISSLFARLGTDIENARERVEELARLNTNAKEHHNAIPAETLQDWAQFAAPRTFGLAVRLVAGLRLADAGPVIHNLVLSNVPGPPLPLYFMGAHIIGLYPLGPIFHGAGLNVTVMSNNGRMNLGLIACGEQVPRIWGLVEKFPAELDELYDAVVT